MVYRTDRNRWVLLTPEGVNHQTRRGLTRNGRTLADLETTGWIVYGPDGYLPPPFEQLFGSTIELTDKARLALTEDDKGDS